LSLYAPKKKRASKKRGKKPEPKKLARKAKPAKKTTTKHRSKVTRAPVKKRATKKQPTVRARRAAERKAAERRAELARLKRNKIRREARVEAKRVEAARLAKLARAQEKRNAARRGARKRVRRVDAKQKKLRLENEKLRLPNPRTTKAKKKKVRAEVNKAVEAPPIVVEFTEAFDELWDIARKTDQLPHIDYRRRKIRSERSVGVKRVVRMGMLVSDDTVEEILYRAKKAAAQLAGYRIWMATSIISSMGPEIVGSGGRTLRSDNPLAFKFQVEAHDSTGVWGSAKGMLDKLEEMLDEWARSEHSALTYLHAVTVHHFTRIG